jgi:hypothetical protein
VNRRRAKGRSDISACVRKGELPNTASSSARPAASSTYSRAKVAASWSGQRAACSAQRSSPTWTAAGSAGLGGVMREDGTGTGIVDTIGTDCLTEGWMRLRADRTKVNRPFPAETLGATEPEYSA